MQCCAFGKVTLLTQVIADARDPTLPNPTRFVGPVWSHAGPGPQSISFMPMAAWQVDDDQLQNNGNKRAAYRAQTVAMSSGTMRNARKAFKMTATSINSCKSAPSTGVR
jgi:hypothetical protein